MIYELALICQEQQSDDAFLQLKEKALSLYCVAIPHEKTIKHVDYVKKASALIIEMQDKIYSMELQPNLLHFQEFMNKAKAKV